MAKEGSCGYGAGVLGTMGRWGKRGRCAKGVLPPPPTPPDIPQPPLGGFEGGSLRPGSNQLGQAGEAEVYGGEREGAECWLLRSTQRA